MRRLAFPAAQLASAGLAFIAWFYLSFRANSEFQELPITALTYGTPLSLVTTAGLAYTFPNLYRGIPEKARRESGAWSASLAICLTTTSTCVIIGVVLSALDSQLLNILGAVFSMTGILGIGIVVAQVGRATSRLFPVFLGALAAPLVPMAWVVGNEFGAPARHVNFLASIAAVFLCLLICLTLNRQAVPSQRSDFASVRPQLCRALPLVPHLVLFGLLIQGVRLTGTWSGDDEILLLSHQVALCASIGYTLLASFNSILTVSLQTESDTGYGVALSRTLNHFVVVGTSAAMLSASAVLFLCLGGTLGTKSLIIAPLIALSVCNVAFYYSLSCQLMRDGRTSALPVSSGAAVVALIGSGAILNGSLIALSFGYAISTSLLPAVLLVASSRGPSRLTLSKGASWLYLIGLPSATLLSGFALSFALT